MDRELKSKTIFGFIWRFLERICAQLVSFVVSIVLARLIAPEQFGVVSVMMIVITFLNVFVDAGFGNALVQKKDADILDYSTVTYFSTFSSIIFYVVLFFTAPLIGKLYNLDNIAIYLRVMGLRMLFSGYNSVQNAYISKNLQFKKFFFVTIIGTVISAIVGIVMAVLGYGIWALVAQYLTNVVCDTIMLTIFARCKIKLKFSFKRLKKIFKFSLAMLGASLFDTLYDESRSMIIGIKYSATDLAYYNRANSVPTLVGNNVNRVISGVLFPLFSKFQDNAQTLKSLLQKYMKVSSFILIPAYLGLAAVANQLIYVLFGENWVVCAPYMQVLCIAYIFSPINNGNLQVFKAMGKTNLVFWNNVIKKAIYTIILVATMWWGVFWIALAAIPINITAIIINAYPTKKLINYSFGEQIKDMLPNLLISLVMFGIVFGIGYIPMNIYALLVLQVIVGVGVYVGLAHLTKNKSYKMCIEMIKEIKKNKQDKNSKEIECETAKAFEDIDYILLLPLETEEQEEREVIYYIENEINSDSDNNSNNDGNDMTSDSSENAEQIVNNSLCEVINTEDITDIDLDNDREVENTKSISS